MNQNTFSSDYFCGWGFKLGHTDLQIAGKSMSTSGFRFDAVRMQVARNVINII